MNRRRYAYGAAVLLLILILAGAVWWVRAAAPPKDAASLYAQTLRDNNISTQVSVDGHVYQVTDGTLSDTTLDAKTRQRVLALAYAQTLAERQPIFDLTGVDPDALDASLDRLAQAQQRLAAAQASTSDPALLSALYPIEFLRTLVQLERTRQTFIMSGSDRDEARYVEQLKAASDAGLRNIGAFNNALTLLLNPQQTKARFLIPGLGGAISLESMYAGAQSEAARMHETVRAVRAQTECLAGAAAQCNPDALALPHIDPLPAFAAPDASQQTTLKEVGAIAREDIFHGAPARTVALAHSECLSSLPGPYYFLDESHTGGPGAPLFYIGDLFFQPITDNSLKQSPFSAYLKATYGVDYLFSNPMAFYVCPEVGADYSRVRAIGALADFAQAHPELEPQLRAPLVADGPLLESDAVAYLRALLDRESASPDAYLPDVTRLALMYRDRTAGLEAMVFEIASINGKHAEDVLHNIPFNISIDSLYVTHSGMQTLYLANNPTAGLSDASFRLDYRNNLTLLAQQLLHYSDQPSDVRTTLVHDLHAMNTFESGQ